MTNQLPVLFSALLDSTMMGRLYAHFSGRTSSPGARLVLTVALDPLSTTFQKPGIHPRLIRNRLSFSACSEVS
jgi:hypothetical protein